MSDALQKNDIAQSILERVVSWWDFLACRAVCKTWREVARRVTWHWYRALPYYLSKMKGKRAVGFCGPRYYGDRLKFDCDPLRHIRLPNGESCWGNPPNLGLFVVPKSVPVDIVLLRAAALRHADRLKYAERHAHSRWVYKQMRFNTSVAECKTAQQRLDEVEADRKHFEGEMKHLESAYKSHLRKRKRVDHNELSRACMQKFEDESGQSDQEEHSA